MGNSGKEQYIGSFTYTDGVLSDFEAMYRMKTSVSPVTRLVLALVSIAGIVLFAVLIAVRGSSPGFLVPLVLFALILLLVLLTGGKKTDSSVQRYRQHYLNKKASVRLDAGGIELKISGQKSYARSKYRDVYSLLETDKTLFLEVKGRAFYILPKDGMDGSTEDLVQFIQKKCGKKFVHYDVSRAQG